MAGGSYGADDYPLVWSGDWKPIPSPVLSISVPPMDEPKDHKGD